MGIFDEALFFLEALVLGEYIAGVESSLIWDFFLFLGPDFSRLMMTF